MVDCLKSPTKLPLAPLNTNAILALNPRFTKGVVNKRQREKLERVSHSFGRADWTVDDYHQRPKLRNYGIDP
jgi:hypothetical protein